MKRSNGELKGMARQMLLGRYQVPMLAMILSSLIPSLFLLPFNYLCSERSTIPMQAVLYYLASFIITLIELLLNCGVKRIKHRPWPAGTGLRYVLGHQKPPGSYLDRRIFDHTDHLDPAHPIICI